MSKITTIFVTMLSFVIFVTERFKMTIRNKIVFFLTEFYNDLIDYALCATHSFGSVFSVFSKSIFLVRPACTKKKTISVN